MYARRTVITNKTGLHARPAADFVGAAGKFQSRIRIKNVADEDESANAKSIVLLLSMSLTKGTEVEISASGPDEKEAVDALIALIESGFGEAD